MSPASRQLELPVIDGEIGIWGKPNWRVDENGCWVWLRSMTSNGYGDIGRGGRNYRAHRWVWECVNGPIPERLELDHLCRNRACVNPDHLEPVTRAVNLRRGLGTKLTPLGVRAIRRSTRTDAELAEMFGVSRPCINRCRKGHSFKDIA